MKDSSTELLHSAWQEQAAKLRQKRQETSSSAGLLHTSTSHLWGLRSSKVAVEGLATVSQVRIAAKNVLVPVLIWRHAVLMHNDTSWRICNMRIPKHLAGS